MCTYIVITYCLGGGISYLHASCVPRRKIAETAFILGRSTQKKTIHDKIDQYNDINDIWDGLTDLKYTPKTLFHINTCLFAQLTDVLSSKNSCAGPYLSNI